MKYELELGANVAVRGTEELERISNAYGRLGEIQKELGAENDRQRAMPGFGGQGSSNLSAQGFQTARAYNDLSLRIQELTNQIMRASDVQKQAVEKGDMNKALQASSSINQMEQEKARLEMLRKGDNDSKENKAAYGLISSKIADYVIKGFEVAGQFSKIGSQYRMAIANGDYTGAEIGKQESYAGMAKNLGGTALGLGATLTATGAGIAGIPLMLLGGLAEIGGIWGEADAASKRADVAEANVYQRTLSYTNALNKRFKNGWGSDKETDEIRNQGLELSKGTGLTNEQFINSAIEMTRFGASSRQAAMQQARSAAVWANATGANLGSVQDFIGLSNRYGINSNTDYLAGARNAMGLAKGQTDEFLTSLKSVIEDGISNGYIKSTEDVSRTFTMFYRLSDNNPLWQGEQGASRFRTMNATISGATAMSDVAQVLTVNAAQNVVNNMSNSRFRELYGRGKSGTYIDYMLATEGGLTPEMFASMGKTISQMEGNNYAARIERWRQMSGLNYAGAVQLDSMYRNADKKELEDPNAFASRIKAINETYRSDETKLIEKMQDIQNAVAEIGKSKFWQNIKTIDSQLAAYIKKVEAEKSKEAKEKAEKANAEAKKNQINSSTNDEITELLKKTPDIFKRAEIVETRRENANRQSLEALKKKDYEGAVNAWLENDPVSFQDFSYKGGALGILNADEESEARKLFLRQLGRYASRDDGKIDAMEIKTALSVLRDNKTIQDNFIKVTKNDEDKDAFNALAAAIEKAFNKVFKNGIVLN